MTGDPAGTCLQEGRHDDASPANESSEVAVEQKSSDPAKQEVCEVIRSSSHDRLPTQTEQQVCRVCQCPDPDKAGEAALKALGICYQSQEQQGAKQTHVGCGGKDTTIIDIPQAMVTNAAAASDGKDNAEVDTCPNANDSLIQLGCGCKSDLALAHYACALRWFVGRDSLVCEICGMLAVNVQAADRDKVISTLREKYSTLRSILSGGEASATTDSMTALLPSSTCSTTSLEAVAWFDPQGNMAAALSVNIPELTVNVAEERGTLISASPATKWAVEGTGILIATGLLTVTITWLFTPRVNKGFARRGLNVFLAALCALAIVVFLRFGVLPRIKYGPARYWAILIVFWFLIFGVWASSTRSSRMSN